VGGLVEVVRNPIHATGVGLLLFGYEEESLGQSESKKRKWNEINLCTDEKLVLGQFLNNSKLNLD
jgi:cell division ATPase FtsA